MREIVKKEGVTMGRFNAAALALLAAACMAAAFSGCGAGPKEEPRREITVFAAASLTDALKARGESYENKHPEIKIVYNFGGSGALQKQIEEGAPADLFLSASPKQMDALKQKGLIVPGSDKVLLVNQVVLIVPKDSDLNPRSFEDLVSPKVKRIALGEPKGVPVGQYAEEIFASLGLLDKLRPKAVYASDVRQALGWVAAGEADCGLVYATDATASDAVKIALTAPEGSHEPVLYPAAVVKSSKRQEQAQAFLNDLFSQESKAAFQKFGFEVK